MKFGMREDVRYSFGLTSIDKNSDLITIPIFEAEFIKIDLTNDRRSPFRKPEENTHWRVGLGFFSQFNVIRKSEEFQLKQVVNGLWDVKRRWKLKDFKGQLILDWDIGLG